MARIRFVACFVPLLVTAPGHADIDAAAADAVVGQQNLQRLVTTLRALADRGVLTGSLQSIADQLDASSQPAAVRAALRTLLPEVARSHFLRENRRTRANPQRRHGGGLRFLDTAAASRDRLTWASTAAPPASERRHRATTDVWLQGWTDEASQDDEDGLDGFDATSRGLKVGFDRSLSERWSAGLSLGRFDNEIDSDRLGQDDQDGDEIAASVFYSWGVHGLAFNYSYARLDTQRSRAVVVDTEAGLRRFLLNSDIDADQQIANLGYSAYLRRDGDWSFSPFASLTYANLATDDYQEFGPGDTLALTVTTKDEEQLIAAAGVSVSFEYFTDNWAIVPSVTLSFEHDLRADPTIATSTFRDTPLSFDTVGFEIEESRWQYALGLTFLHRDGFGIGLTYDGHRKDNYASDAAILSLQIRL